MCNMPTVRGQRRADDNFLYDRLALRAAGRTVMWEKTSQPRILCVSIYDELGEMVTNYAQQYGVTVDIYKGGIYNNGHIHALENQDKYDVIISRPARLWPSSGW